MEVTEQGCREMAAKLEKTTEKDPSGVGAIELLKLVLDADVKDKLKILSATKLSKVVVKLSKRDGCDREVRDLAEQVIQKWRRILNAPKASAKNAAPAPAPAPAPSPSSASSGFKSRPVAKTGEPTRDMVRQKLQQVFEAGIAANESRLREHESDTAEMAQEAEQALFDRYCGVDKEYKQRFRSLIFNLRDEKNPDFILSVVSGQTHVNDLATMDIKDMASEEMKRTRSNWVENKKMALMDSKSYEQYTGKKQQDGILKCPKCKSMKTEYTEVQTRSADEPTTKKCFCNDCNYRWKFC
uniref:Transcription elongation factor S-II n=1 Tax=Chrysotila carterae TaxID=13221 RepID=A0A7S4F3R9_CHRCT|mmetsp:Transcript_36035/g.75796  ORF Transcript_36035/g.75796 Transcript_36035/m.75796 type:complete len:298 (+) Transcript_36035:26-919(+)